MPRPKPAEGVRKMRPAKFSTGAKLKPAEAQLQGSAALARRVLMSETYADIARLFGTNPKAISDRISLAITSDLTQLTRDLIAEKCLPKALALLSVELDNGNYEAAKDVLYGMGALSKMSKSTMEHISSSTPTLDQIRKERAIDITSQAADIVSAPAPEPKVAG